VHADEDEKHRSEDKRKDDVADRLGRHERTLTLCGDAYPDGAAGWLVAVPAYGCARQSLEEQRDLSELSKAYAAHGRPTIERLEQEAVEAAMARVALVARVMDALFVIPGTGIRLGFDAILGLVPVAGDLIAQAIATYVIWEALQLGVGKVTLLRIFGNTLIDTLVGSIPIAGDAFDVAFRANLQNLRLLQRHLEKQGYLRAGKGPVVDGDWRRVV
jgi:hypothetical protein